MINGVGQENLKYRDPLIFCVYKVGRRKNQRNRSVKLWSCLDISLLKQFKFYERKKKTLSRIEFQNLPVK